MPPEQIAGIGLLGVLFGGIIGWAAARHVDEQRAKRDAYARYLAAADDVVLKLVRRVVSAKSGQSPLDPMPSNEAADTAFSELLILASHDMVARISKIVDCLNTMASIAKSRESIADPAADWNQAAATYNRLRREFIDSARKEVGAGRLPDDLFAESGHVETRP
jgi:enamine deaminase RidA (YjgF/YER057c/UK114 family)